MTTNRPAELVEEVETYIVEILEHAERRAAALVADASHRSARRVAQVRRELPALWAARRALQADVLGRLAKAASEALDDERWRVASALDALRDRQLAELSALGERVDGMAAGFTAPARPVALPPPPPPGVVPQAEEAESPPFAELRRVLWAV